MHWFLNPILKKYVTFSGRATRKEFWMFVLMLFLFEIILPIILLGLSLTLEIPTLLVVAAFFYFVLPILVLLPHLALGARRLHDIGRSGWWQLIAFVPLIGIIVIIVFFATSGIREDNRFGTSPYSH